MSRFGTPPDGGDDEHVHVAVVFAGEGDARAVGRKRRIGFDAGAAGEAHGVAAITRHTPQIARVGEHDMGFAQRGLLQQQRFVGAAAMAARAKKASIRRIGPPCIPA